MKLLWIEDKPDEKLPKKGAEWDRDWGRVFDLHLCTTPEKVVEMLREGQSREKEARRSANYALSGYPFDVILADARLSEPRKGQPSSAASATGAGFTIAVLTALHAPDHPVAILPYSAWREEFGSQYELLKMFCPATVFVPWDERLHMEEINRPYLLERAIEQYRGALLKGMETGVVHIALSERNRLIGLCDSRIEPSETITVLTPWGRRTIGLSVLFFDRINATSAVNSSTLPAAELHDWVSSLPGLTREEQVAQSLAALYWGLANTPWSVWTYYVRGKLERGEDVSEFNAKIKPTHTHPWLALIKKKLDPKTSDQILRLAVLFLILREFAHRSERLRAYLADRAKLHAEGKLLVVPKGTRYEDVSSDDLKAMYEHLRGYFDKEGSEKARSVFFGMVEKMSEGDDRRVQTLAHILDELENHAIIQEFNSPPSEADIARLLNPLPTEWTFPLNLNKDEMIGKGLAERIDPPLEVRALLQGNGSSLKEIERICVQRYALEHFPSRADWPDWVG